MEAGLLRGVYPEERRARNDTEIRESPGEHQQGGLFESGLTDRGSKSSGVEEACIPSLNYHLRHRFGTL